MVFLLSVIVERQVLLLPPLPRVQMPQSLKPRSRASKKEWGAARQARRVSDKHLQTGGHGVVGRDGRQESLLKVIWV